MANKRYLAIACGLILACTPGADLEPEGVQSAVPRSCEMPTQRTVLRAEAGAIIETWELSLADVQTEDLPDEPAFLEYRAAIERDGAALRRPVADLPLIDTDELEAIWENEFFNNDLVFDRGVGSVDPISCLDALLFARQAGRVSQLEQPTEFTASVLRRDLMDDPRVLVVFAAGSEMFVPRDFYGFDTVKDHVADGWDYWYAIHNHTVQANGDRMALGVPAPSTSDVQLLRNLATELSLDSVRVTNGFFTFKAAVEDLNEFRAR